MAKQKQGVQYRYYEMSPNSYVLALLGSGWRRIYGHDAPENHFHNYFEIGYCYEGTGEMVFGEERFPYRSGSITMIPATYLHNTFSTLGTQNQWEYLFVDVEGFIKTAYHDNPQMIKTLLSRINSKAHIYRVEDIPLLAQMIIELMELYRRKEEMYLETAKGLLQAALIQLAMLTPKQPVAGRYATGGNEVIKQALAWISEHYSEKISIADIAQACHLSETHFRRVFSQAMQLSPLHFVNLVRVEAACRLLRSTSDPVQDIALHCGFITLPSFNRNFKDILGVSPREWRKDTSFYERQLEKQNIMLYNGWQ